MAYKPSKTRHFPIVPLILLILAVLLTLVLALFVAYGLPALGLYDAPASQSLEVPTQTTAPATEPLPKTVVTADGISSSLKCRDNYAVPVSTSMEAAGRTAAVMGERTLTNAQLQIYYLNAVKTHQLSGVPQQPVASLPLEEQLCPLGEDGLSWQHYFLQQAIRAWQMETLLLQAAQAPRIIQEEAFKPNEMWDMHKEYVAPELPVNRYLYSDKPCYTPNSMHQAYLDTLEETMNAQAVQLGYADLSSGAGAVFGSSVSAQVLVEAAAAYNTAYMLFTEESYDTADLRVLAERFQTQASQSQLNVDYSAAALWTDPNASMVLPVDVLYPDVAHERFPEPITYFQQDYNYYPFGNSGKYIGSTGCGITTFAMLATYMTDTIYTPAMLSDRFPEYCLADGTDGRLFQSGAKELGFTMTHTTNNCNDGIIEALERGQMVICLQAKGYFTTKGHYLLLCGYDQASETIELRDSNIYHYGNMKEHKTGFFGKGVVFDAGAPYYVYNKKDVTTPACPRCGSNPQVDAQLCTRCTTAQARRNAFLTLMSE